MSFHFAQKGPVSLQSLRKSSSRKSTLRILVYLILLVISLTNFLELKTIHHLLRQISQSSKYTVPTLKLKEVSYVH